MKVLEFSMNKGDLILLRKRAVVYAPRTPVVVLLCLRVKEAPPLTWCFYSSLCYAQKLTLAVDLYDYRQKMTFLSNDESLTNTLGTLISRFYEDLIKKVPLASVLNFPYKKYPISPTSVALIVIIRSITCKTW